MAENYIDEGMKALKTLRDILTPHGIQITRVNGLENKSVVAGSALGNVAMPVGEATAISLEVYVSSESESDSDDPSKSKNRS